MTDKLSGYSTTPASNNAASPDGWPEGMTAGSVNNSDREFAARVREFYEDSQWIDYGHTIVSSTGSSIKLSGDVTAIYTAGRAIRVNQSASQDGWVSASAYSAPDTSITVTGFTVAAPTQVEVGAVVDHTVLPNNLSITVASLAATSISTASIAISGTLTASAVSFTAASITTLDSSTLTVSSILNDDGTAFTSVPNMVVKTTGTAATYTLTAGAKALEFILVGGGGGGGDNGNATSGGATSIIYNSVTITAGGGVHGGTTGAGGTASGGTLNINGQAGRDCFGGSAGLGYGYGGKTATAGSGYGGGGGADATGSLGGGGGACAIYRVDRVAGQDTVTYSVGAAGVGNTGAGTDGKNGAAGVLIIRY